ncbi:fimbrial biogenesis chaperone [Burkholderia cepacia]|uniref:fimbrial biogenesis chaperone n=1 Tax=Burkholderia cepacia TaxID=292 RepID=UPI000AB5D3F7|nr:fimbria/pilus periplasmic chaperone [Burkholderia cepacia]UIY56596.1 fimbria/pilus periplasmic chaperone [Burkholderia cepacia]
MKISWRNGLYAALLGLSAAAAIDSAHASVVIDNTRVIFRGTERETSIKMTNAGDRPAFVQVWIDKGEVQASPETIDVPFTLTPTMFRLDAKKGQTVRMIYTREPLAQDRETLFWLNALEVPPKATDEEAGENYLQFAFRTRIKVMYRPKGLSGDPLDAPGKVRWSVMRSEGGGGYVLKGENPTPYFVNLGEVTLKSGGRSYSTGNGYVPPFSSQTFPIERLARQPDADAEVDYLSINDYGAGVPGTHPLKSPAQR